MTAQEFCYWLQGLMAAVGPILNAEQTSLVKAQLARVMAPVTILSVWHPTAPYQPSDYDYTRFPPETVWFDANS